MFELFHEFKVRFREKLCGFMDLCRSTFCNGGDMGFYEFPMLLKNLGLPCHVIKENNGFPS